MNIVKTLLVTLVLSLSSTYAFSFDHHGPDSYKSKGGRHSHGGEFCNKDHSGDATKVPEINAGGAAIALALLGGLVLVSWERRRSDKA